MFRRLWLLPLAGLLLLGAPRRIDRVTDPRPDDPNDAQEIWFARQRAFPFSEIPRATRAIVRESASKDDVWSSIGPAPIQTVPPFVIANTGRVTGILVSPANPKIVVAGSSGGGIWRSTDGGDTFVPVSDDQAGLTIGSMAIAPSNPNVMYAGMGDDRYGTGILKSTDAGATWHATGGGSFPGISQTKKILVDPQNENVVWLLQKNYLDSSDKLLVRSSLYESTDGGVTWSVAFAAVVTDVVIASADGATLFAGVTTLPGKFGSGGIYRSTDRGASWTSVYGGADPTTPPKYYLAASSGTLYAATIDSADGDTTDYRFLKSTDGGTTWSQVSTYPTQSRVFYVAANPVNPRTVYIGAISGLRSTDGGLTWSGMPTHLDHHAIAFDPVDPSHIWIGNDGGLFRSSDGGATIESLAGKLPVAQFYAVNAHPTRADVLYGGSQDNGLQIRNANRLEWNEIVSGDFGTEIFDRNDPDRFMTQSFYSNVARYKNGSIEWIGTSQTFNDTAGIPRSAFIAPLVEGPDGTVWFATWRLFATKDFGTTWTTPGGLTDLTTGANDGRFPDCVNAVGIGDSDATVLYAGSAQGRVMVTRDEGVTWTDVTPPVQRAVGAIAVDRTSSATAYLGYSGFQNDHLYRTTNYGATWTSASKGLPDVPINAIYIDKSSPSTLYAGTDAGVWRSDDAGDNWVSFNNGMPPVVVTSFTTTVDGRLIAGTYGRGVYVLLRNQDSRRRAVKH